MIINVFAETVKEALGKGIEDEKAKSQLRYLGTGDEEKVLQWDVASLKDSELAQLVELLALDPKNVRKARAANIVRNWISIKENPKGASVTNINQFKAALVAYMKKVPYYMLFKRGMDGNLVPYLVTSVDFHPPAEETPAYVRITLGYFEFSEKKSTDVTFTQVDVHRRPVNEVLMREDLYPATEELLADWEADVRVYKEVAPNIGKQMLGQGKGFRKSSWHTSTVVNLDKDGAPARLVVDTHAPENGMQSPTISLGFWIGGEGWRSKSGGARRGSSSLNKEELDEIPTFDLPQHPIVELFDLKQHTEVHAHVRALQEYVYDPSLSRSLVIPDDVREVVEVLIHSSTVNLGDIIAGKSGGATLLVSGPPGVGKTLTAEVFSEIVGRSLYSVQCAQLGTDEVALEKKLQEVLRRAARWGALLLLDEADVYIRQRGADIQQNAIVGVFLRVLEYYNGVLFMTTNVALSSVDDAIISRATAQIQYQPPTQEELGKIWQVLAKTYGVDLKPEWVGELVKTFPTITGRDVKNLLKLGIMMAAARKVEVTPEIISKVAKFKLGADTRLTKLHD